MAFEDLTRIGRELPKAPIGQAPAGYLADLQPLTRVRSRGVWFDLTGPQPRSQSGKAMQVRNALYREGEAGFGFEISTRTIDGFNHLVGRYVG